MVLFIIPAIRFPKIVVELKATPALIIIAKKLKIWPFRLLSIGKTKIKEMVPKSIASNEMLCFVTLVPEDFSFKRLKNHELKNKKATRIKIIPVGSMNNFSVLIICSIFNYYSI